MPFVVTKFGGTSVSGLTTWQNIANITHNHIKNGFRPIIACSALTQISNLLEQAIDAALQHQHQDIVADIIQRHSVFAQAIGVSEQLIASELAQLQECLFGIACLKIAPPKTRALIMGLGEYMMTRLGAAFLQQQGIRTHWHDARETVITHPLQNADSAADYLAGKCPGDPQPDLQSRFQTMDTDAIITQGFVASNAQGEPTLLGRGGSDTSAALFAAFLEAELCEIWTDVPGIYTANPRQIPQARLLKQLHYDEAQEIASMGSKVLQPNCIPPVKKANIPMMVKYTEHPQHSGTRISSERDETAPLIKSLQVKHSITLVSIDTLNMWQQVGFLADVFHAFKQYGFSVDLLSSSEFNVTVSLDTNIKQPPREKLEQLLDALNTFGRARLIEPCSAVSLVGHHIRTVLPASGSIFEVFEDKQIHMMSLASNDLNLTFVVDESHAEKLCQKLHHVLIESNPQHFYYSKSWHEEFVLHNKKPTPWWESARDTLLNIAQEKAPCYIYHRPTLRKQAQALQSMQAIDKLFYAIKANANPDVLRTLFQENIGFECVSQEELAHVHATIPDIPAQSVLFTPNFAPITEYRYAFEKGCVVTVDNLYLLETWPEDFKNRSIFLRIDPGSGAGHHKFVCTAGNESKFGIPKHDLEKAAQRCKALKIQVIGLHAHSGSGILTPELWENTARLLTDLTRIFPEVRTINLGGGLGVADKPGQQNMDLSALDAGLARVHALHPGLRFWLEPGRFFVSDAGVLLATVTQCKDKGKVHFIGINTGMNSLIRPALYGAYHEIVNLTHLYEPITHSAHVVGPICESADTLGYDRAFPATQAGDTIAIANTGAYGYCMGSHYNLRPPAAEYCID